MWHDTPSANDLRETFPDLALALETDYLANHLERLGIQFIRRSRKKTAVLEVALQPNFLLRIQPVDKAKDGYSEWLTWSWKQPESEEDVPTLESSVRAFVEFIDLSEEDEQNVVSFTTHCDDMHDLVRSAIAGMRHISGKRLKPVIVSRRKAA